MWTQYERVFRRLGVKHLYHLDVEAREEACEERKAKILDDAVGVFFSGGDQIKITMMLGGTEIVRCIRAIYGGGGVIAGTSAGASVMCDTMIVGGGSNGSARIGHTVRMAPGLGLISDVLIDQHFAERGRVPRLVGAIAQNPCMLGIGIDEDTAIVVERWGRRFRVIGNGAVYLFNARDMSYANLSEEEPDRTLSVFDVRMDMLSQGDSYDLTTRRPMHGTAEDVEKEIEDEVAA
jgi:cyanophycinase